MERLFIVCKNEKEESKVLEELEKQGKVWLMSKGKPTKKSFFKNEYSEFAIVVCENGDITWTVDVTNIIWRSKSGKKISAAEFLKKNEETIVIYRNGAETIAFEKNTGRKAVAKCHAVDTYSFEVGAKLALERLFPETVREVKRHAEVGEYIKITDPRATMGRYKKGDVFRVKEAFPPKNYTVQYVECYELINISICYDEYVVLENYKPEEKPQQYYNGKVVCVVDSGQGLFTKGKIYEIVDGIITFNNGVNGCKRLENIEEINNIFVSQFIELVE